jgi:hypothetical protein
LALNWVCFCGIGRPIFFVMLYKLCEKTHKLACGMNGSPESRFPKKSFYGLMASRTIP